MSSHSYRILTLGTALGLLSFPSPAFSQVAEITTTEEETSENAEGTSPSSKRDDGSVTLLKRIDVGAGAEGTAGTDVIAITPEEMDRKKPTDLREVFEGEPQIAVGGAIPSTQKIYINGIDETNLAVTVDGSRQNNKVFHHNGTYIIDPALLKAVTVQAGVAPADAGPGAMAGSMGFETKDADDLLEEGKTFGGFVTGWWDTNSKTYKAGLSMFGKRDGFEYMGFINYSEGDNFTAGNGQEMPGTGTNLLSGLAKVAYESTEGHRFELSHERVSDDDLRPYRADFYFNRFFEPDLRPYDLDRQNTVFTYTTTNAEGWWDPKVVLAYSRTKTSAPEWSYWDNGTDPEEDDEILISPTTGTTSSFNGKVENKFALDMGSVTAGFDFYSDVADIDYYHVYGESYFLDERATNIGLYAQARLEPTDRMRLSFGGRADNQWFTGVDDSEFTNAGISGNVSGEYDILPDYLTVKAGASRVWGGIPLAENYVQYTDWFYGADGPEPVTSTNYTAGVIGYYDALTVEANVFWTDIKNARTPTFGSATQNHDVETNGWEIGGTYTFDAGFVSVKYADVNAEVDGSYPDSYIGRYLTTPIGQVIMIGAGYEFFDWGLKVGGSAEIALKNSDTLQRHSSDPVSEKQALPGYEVFNAYAEWTPPSHPNITLRLDALNIFDETYTDRAAYVQDFVGEQPHLDPGRSFRLAATARF